MFEPSTATARCGAHLGRPHVAGPKRMPQRSRICARRSSSTSRSHGASVGSFRSGLTRSTPGADDALDDSKDAGAGPSWTTLDRRHRSESRCRGGGLPVLVRRADARATGRSRQRMPRELPRDARTPWPTPTSKSSSPHSTPAALDTWSLVRTRSPFTRVPAPHSPPATATRAASGGPLSASRRGRGGGRAGRSPTRPASCRG